MNTSGIVLFSISWTVIIGLLVFCYTKVLKK